MSFTPENRFDYSTLNPESATVVQACTREIQSRMVKTIEQMVAIGEKLQIAKHELTPLQFQSWLLYELDLHPRQARRLILVARQFRRDKLSQYRIAPSALYLLAEIKTPVAARDEAINRAALGEIITLRIAKEIVSRHKGVGGQTPAAATASASASHHQVNAKKTAEMLEPEVPQEHKKKTMTVLDATNQNYKDETEDRAENAIVDIPAVTIPEETAQQVSPRFSVGDRVRILRRQEGKDKWTGCTAQIWEVTPDGWLRVNVEVYKGVKFTLNPDWVQLLEDEDSMLPDNSKPKASLNDCFKRTVRIPVEICGEILEVEGIAKRVEVQWEHNGRRSTAFVPIEEVVFNDAQ